ncbi:MAG: mechanosensitive ion channel family protein [Acidimicrobiales bacterium]
MLNPSSPVVAWARTAGLQIVLIALGAALVARLVHWLGMVFSRQVERRVKSQLAAGLVPSEQSKHLRLVIQATEWGAAAIVYFVAGIVILVKFRLPLASLVAPATVIGVGLGFGAQRVVQDLLAGIFLFAEHQYGFGDVVRIGQVGATIGVTGTIEEVTLRTTSLRTLAGELVIIPNGQIPQVTNLSREWSRAVVDIPLSPEEDLDRATDVLRKVGEELKADEAWAPLLLEAPTVSGIQAIEVGYIQVRIMVRTKSGSQWAVGVEIRRRVVLAFREAGITPPTAVFGPGAPGGA